MGQQASEVGVQFMRTEPPNGSTVAAGTAVAFSGESDVPLMFRVASSEALLSSPDIDSGTGTQSGAFSTFTSDTATVTPRTIYWTASLTETVEDCEGPSTFTTPVRTLVVAPSAAELASSEQQQDEAAKRGAEEEHAAAKKREEAETAAAGSVAPDGSTLEVQDRREATVTLTCLDIATCAGKLTLTASITTGKGKARHAWTESIGTASFSIAADETTAVRLTLDRTGRALLGTAHGHLSATMTIVRTAPSPTETQTRRVRLEQQATQAKG